MTSRGRRCLELLQEKKEVVKPEPVVEQMEDQDFEASGAAASSHVNSEGSIFTVTVINPEDLGVPDEEVHYFEVNSDCTVLGLDMKFLEHDVGTTETSRQQTADELIIPTIANVTDNGKEDGSTVALESNNEKSPVESTPEADISEIEEHDSSSDAENEQVGAGKRIKKSTPQKIRRKRKRSSGVPYLSSKGKMCSGRSLQAIPCNNCANDCKHNFSEEDRQEIFTSYWSIGDNQRQKDWLMSCMEISEKQSGQGNNSRRNQTVQYFLKVNGLSTKVCKSFLISTLDIGEKLLRYTRTHAPQIGTAKLDKRGRHAPHNKTAGESSESVDNFIKRLPAVPSHYCRASTTRKYLPTEFKNKQHLARMYQIKPASIQVFIKRFSAEYNIGFHTPKKDKCTFCESVKNNPDHPVSTEAREKHDREKVECKTVFANDQRRRINDPNVLCISFDLQKVLNVPHGESMLLYYSRKYTCYNLTVYESVSKDSFCYLWGEADGKRGTNEICSIMHKYLTMVDERDPPIKTVILYCDSCPGQNKNRQMLFMLHYFINRCTNIEDIKITYLLPGHTYMPVDSVHSTIESNLKKKIIWSPEEWPKVIREARHNPRPYETVQLIHSDFADWKQMTNLHTPKSMKATNGNIVEFRHMKSASFQKDSSIMCIRYNYNINDTEVPWRCPYFVIHEIYEKGEIQVPKTFVGVCMRLGCPYLKQNLMI